MKTLITILFLAVTLFAQNDWKSKDFDKWDTKDVETILNKSSWIVKQSFKSGYNEISKSNEITMTVRLRSSMAIRLALIRQIQLGMEKQNLKPEEKEAYLKKQKGLYDCPACVDNFVITISSVSSETGQYDHIYNYYRTTTLEQLKKNIFLQNDKGEKRELVHFVAPKTPGDEAQFFFNRFDDKNNLFLSKESKYFLFRLEPDNLNSAMNFKIETKPILIGEKVDF
jgi:hypothetical protein